MNVAHWKGLQRIQRFVRSNHGYSDQVHCVKWDLAGSIRPGMSGLQIRLHCHCSKTQNRLLNWLQVNVQGRVPKDMMGSTRLRNFNYSRNTVAKTFKNNLFAEEIRNLLTSTYVNMEWKPLIQNDDWNCTNLKGSIATTWLFSTTESHVLVSANLGFLGTTHSTSFYTPFVKEPIHHPTNKSLYASFCQSNPKNQPPERSTWNGSGKLRQAAVADVWKGICYENVEQY